LIFHRMIFFNMLMKSQHLKRERLKPKNALLAVFTIITMRLLEQHKRTPRQIMIISHSERIQSSFMFWIAQRMIMNRDHALGLPLIRQPGSSNHSLHIPVVQIRYIDCTYMIRGLSNKSHSGLRPWLRVERYLRSTI
jgi:hypothetical protein